MRPALHVASKLMLQDLGMAFVGRHMVPPPSLPHPVAIATPARHA
jgi:hypothetical protein